MTKKKACKSCGSTTRKLPHPGPRCASCHRAVRQERKDRSWSQRIERDYNMSADTYWMLYEFQGGRCAICRRATGGKGGTGRGSRRLAIEHDHACCPAPPTCGKCTYALCCSRCNSMLGHIRRDIATAERVVNYLIHPPMMAMMEDEDVDALEPNALLC